MTSPYSPKNSAGLFVFTPPKGALAPGEKVRIGFEHEGTYPGESARKEAGRWSLSCRRPWC